MIHARPATSGYSVAQVLAGGHVVQHSSGGQFFAPTVLINITSDMRIWRYVCIHSFVRSCIQSFIHSTCIFPFSTLRVSFIQSYVYMDKVVRLGMCVCVCVQAVASWCHMNIKHSAACKTAAQYVSPLSGSSVTLRLCSKPAHEAVPCGAQEHPVCKDTIGPFSGCKQTSHWTSGLCDVPSSNPYYVVPCISLTHGDANLQGRGVWACFSSCEVPHRC